MLNLKKLKILVFSIWTIFIFAMIFVQIFSPVRGQSQQVINNEKAKLNLKPENALIKRFDTAIQERFLTMPDFGIRRIQPANPPGPHLEYFSPINDVEKQSVAAFEEGDWKVSLYLFGRRANPRIVDGKETKKFSINYRLNPPLSITDETRTVILPRSKELIGEVKKAFIEFQTPESPNENNYEFSIGDWSYVAKPVRAVNESCLKCHTDYVVTEKIGDHRFKFRKRAVGDANGVIVYGFARKN